MSDFIGRTLVRAVYRSEMKPEDRFNPKIRFDPDGHQVWNELGEPMIFFDQEVVVDRVDPSLDGTIIRDNPPSLAPLASRNESSA